MAEISLEDAIPRLKSNENRFDGFINGEGYTSSQGEVVPSVREVIQGLRSFNVRGNWVTGTAYALKDVYTSGSVSYVTLTAHTSTTIAADLASGKVTIFQNGIFTPSGANGIPQTILSRMLKSVYADEYPSLRDAISALPASGGTVYVLGRIKAGVWTFDTNYMARENVHLRGAQPPAIAYDCTKVEGASIIEGKFNVFANNFSVQDIGFDCGKFVCDRDYPGLDTHSENHPNGGTWDAFAFAQPNQSNPLPARRGFFAKNVIGLNRDSQSYGHAVLMEGFDGGFVDNTVGMYGVHGLVIKAKNVKVTSISGYGAMVDDIIFKSDSYAIGGNISVDILTTDKAPPNTVPWSTPANAVYSLLCNPATASMGSVKIGKARLFGATSLLACDGPNPNLSMDALTIDQIEMDGTGVPNVLAIRMITVKHYRCKIALASISNVSDCVAYSQSDAAGGYSADPLFIDSLTCTNVSLRAIQALNYGRIVINNFRIAGNVNTMYAIDDSARVHINREEITGTLGIKFSNNSPALTSGWQQFAGQQQFAVKLENYGVKFQGLLQKIGNGDTNIVSLPTYLRPASATRLSTLGKGADSKYNTMMIGGDPSFGFLQLNEGLNTTGCEQFLSLQGVAYGLD